MCYNLCGYFQYPNPQLFRGNDIHGCPHSQYICLGLFNPFKGILYYSPTFRIGLGLFNKRLDIISQDIGQDWHQIRAYA